MISESKQCHSSCIYNNVLSTYLGRRLTFSWIPDPAPPYGDPARLFEIQHLKCEIQQLAIEIRCGVKFCQPVLFLHFNSCNCRIFAYTINMW